MVDRNRPRQEINLDQAKAFGTRFSIERSSRNLSHQEVADALLLSKKQVADLERVNLQKFYSARLFSQAADKYANYLDFTDKPSEYILGATPDCRDNDVEVESVIETPATRRPSKRSISTLHVVIGFGVAIVAAVVGKILIDPKQEAVRTPGPTQPIVEQPPSNVTPHSSAAGVVPITASKATDDVPTNSIHLQFSGTSWVQTVTTNGQKQDRTYKKGDSLTLEQSKLQALVIGNAKSVTLTTANGTISLNPYISAGSQVARLIGIQIRQMK